MIKTNKKKLDELLEKVIKKRILWWEQKIKKSQRKDKYDEEYVIEYKRYIDILKSILEEAQKEKEEETNG